MDRIRKFVENATIEELTKLLEKYNIKFESNKKVFLGGTCNNSEWREQLIRMLEIDYFNPVVDDWNEEAYQEELRQREICDYCLYVITPKMTGVYSIAEVIDDSNKRPEKTIFCLITADYSDGEDKPLFFTKSQLKSLQKVGRMVEKNGGKFFGYLTEVADYLNNN